MNYLNYLFKSLIIGIIYGLSVYGCSSTEPNTIQRFLNRCHRRKYTTELANIYDMLESQDKNIFNTSDT